MRVWGSKFAFKNEAKSIKKQCRDGRAFWDRFFIDFGGLRGPPSWEAKASQEGAKTRLGRPRKASARQEAKTGKSSQVKSVAAENRVTLLGGGGVYPTLKGGTSQGLGVVVFIVVGASCCDFLAILLPFVFSSFFRCHF